MSKAGPKRHASAEVDEVLAVQADEFRETFEQLREIINRMAPGCSERLSYRIPIFRRKKDFVAMSAAKRHIGLHSMSKTVPRAMKDELQAFGIWISGATLLIRPGSDLPVALLERALRARIAEMKDG